MKRWLAGLVIGGVLVLGALLWFLPARWVLPFVQPRLRGVRIEQVGGTVWQGHAGQVSIIGGPVLGSLAWTLSHRALLGDIRAEVDLRQPRLHGQGHVRRISSTRTDLRDATLHVDVALLGPQLWLRGAPQGWLDLRIAQAQWQGGWPMQIDAAGTWSQASLQTAQGEVRFGTVLLAVTGQSGVLQARFHDAGDGAVQTTGRLSFSPLGWNLRIELKPRNDDPTVRQWVRSLGTPAADGRLELRYRGGLVQLTPE